MINHTSVEDDIDEDTSEEEAIEDDESGIDDSFVGELVFEEKKRKSFSCLSPSEIVAYPSLYLFTYNIAPNNYNSLHCIKFTIANNKPK